LLELSDVISETTAAAAAAAAAGVDLQWWHAEAAGRLQVAETPHRSVRQLLLPAVDVCWDDPAHHRATVSGSTVSQYRCWPAPVEYQPRHLVWSHGQSRYTRSTQLISWHAVLWSSEWVPG